MDRVNPDGVQQLSEKHTLAREALPADLRPIFDDPVADYRFLVSGTTTVLSSPISFSLIS